MKKILLLIAVLGIAINSYSQTPINNTMTEDEIYSTSFTVVEKHKVQDNDFKVKYRYLILKDNYSDRTISVLVSKESYKRQKMGYILSGTRVMSIKE